MVVSGLDVLLNDTAQLKGKSIGLLVNYTSVTSRLSYIWDELLKAGLNIKVILSPEHGLFGTEQDQAPVNEQKGISLPLVSLYGNSKKTLVPDEETLQGIDCIIYDIQDVGSRYYTYVNTMAYVMKAVSGRGIEFIVLDRPNPLGGVEIEGPVLQSGYESFVGVLPVSVRHGMTAGELAVMAREHFKLDVDLKVIKMQGWKRDMHYPDTGLPWVYPSPNMPDYETALLYPGLCLLEGMDVSEGRGTTMPFRIIGAPYVNAKSLAERLNGLALEGVYFRPHCFKPGFNKFQGHVVEGVQIHVLGHRALKPFQTGVAIAATLYNMHEESRFLHGVYEFNDVHPAFDLLAGSDTIRSLIESGSDIKDIFQSWAGEEQEFARSRERYLLY